MDPDMEEGELDDDSQQSQSDEFVKTTKAGRKNLCAVCRAGIAKYTCPRCANKSCSIVCINKHKAEKDCSGRADVVANVPRSEIDENVVRKDYQFVKEMLAESDKVKKTLTGVTANVQEPKRFYFLRKQAKSEYNIKVHQAPPLFQRHGENISFFYMKTKTIYWVIELLYISGKKSYSRHLLDPTPDSKTVGQILPTNFLCQQLLLKGINTNKSEDFCVYIENREQQQKKEKKETITQVERDKPLRDALREKNIYQYPTLIVVHNSLKPSYQKWHKVKT